MMDPELDNLICAEIDWAHPGLTSTLALQCFRSGNPAGAAEGFVGYLRSREESRTGYSREYIRHLRAICPAGEANAARERVEARMSLSMILPYHSNPFASLGPETLFLIRDPEIFESMGQRVMDHRPNWDKGFQFGGTGSICEVLRCLLLIEECPARAITPWLGWLIVRAGDEWRRTARWSETTLGICNHNWWAHAFSGFYMAGLLVPEFKGLAKFENLAANYLEQVLPELFEEDGWSREGSPGYHEFAAGVVLEMARLAELNGVVLSEAVRQKLRIIAGASWQVMLPDGQYPLFGDYVHAGKYAGFTGQGRPDRLPCAMLRRHAARFSIGQSKFVAESLDPGWSPLFGGLLPDHGHDLLPAYRRLAASHPGGADTALAKSGLYVMRQDWTPLADCMALTAGITGPRATSHKHADLLSFELYSRGRRILVDNGYGLPGEEREDDVGRMWRVGSSAHNTVTVDGAESVKILGEFVYGQTVIPVVDKWTSSGDYAYFSSVHEGYLRLENAVSAVRRKVFYLRGRYWILIDRFTTGAEAEHEYQLHFHFNVPVCVTDEGRAVTSGEGGNLLIVPVDGFSGKPSLRDNPHPIENYENPRQLTYTRTKTGRDLMVTLLVPFADEELPEVSARVVEVGCDGRKLSPWEGTGLEIGIDGERHFYFDQHMAWTLPWTHESHSGNRRLYHSECLD